MILYKHLHLKQIRLSLNQCSGRLWYLYRWAHLITQPTSLKVAADTTRMVCKDGRTEQHKIQGVKQVWNIIFIYSAMRDEKMWLAVIAVSMVLGALWHFKNEVFQKRRKRVGLTLKNDNSKYKFFLILNGCHKRRRMVLLGVLYIYPVHNDGLSKLTSCLALTGCHFRCRWRKHQ